MFLYCIYDWDYVGYKLVNFYLLIYFYLGCSYTVIISYILLLPII